MTYRETEEYRMELEAHRRNTTVWSMSCENRPQPIREIVYHPPLQPTPTTRSFRSFHQRDQPDEELCWLCQQTGHKATILEVDPNDEEVREIDEAFDKSFRIFGGDQSAPSE